MGAYKGERYNRIRSTKAWSPPSPISSGFYRATVKKVTATNSGGTPPKIEVDTDLGHSNVEVTDFVGSPPRVGEEVWVTFCESRPDDLMIINPQHQNDNENQYYGVTRLGGQTEQYGVTLKIEPTSHPDSRRASIMMDETIMGTDLTGTKATGDWYVFDNVNNKYMLKHGGHSNTTNGGLTVKSTGLSERYLQLHPAFVSSGSEYSAIFGDNANSWLLINRGLYTFTHTPYNDNTYDLGYNSGGVTNRWQDIHLVNSPSVTSDKNEKTDIADSDLGLNFIKALRPVSFKWIDRGGGDAGVRTHYGLLAQDVETVLGDAAPNTALWMTNHVDAKDAVPADEHLPGQPAVEEHDVQGLRYTELISPIIKAIQELEARVAALES